MLSFFLFARYKPDLSISLCISAAPSHEDVCIQSSLSQKSYYKEEPPHPLVVKRGLPV